MPYRFYTLPAPAPHLQGRDYSFQFLKKKLNLKSLVTCLQLHIRNQRNWYSDTTRTDFSVRLSPLYKVSSSQEELVGCPLGLDGNILGWWNFSRMFSNLNT